MSTLRIAVLAAIMGATLSACSYAGVATTGDKVIILKNGFMGFTRYVVVCKVDNDGVSECEPMAEAP